MGQIPWAFLCFFLGNSLLELLTWGALRQCEQECKVFSSNNMGAVNGATLSLSKAHKPVKHP